MRRNGLPIAQAPLSGGGVNPGITYNSIFEEWEAATAAGLDMYSWENGKYPPWFMARTLVWYRNHRYVETHTKDAVNRKSSKK